MAATDITFIGVSHMIGASVEVAIGGLDCGAHVVATGGVVTVPLASIPVPTGFPDAATYFQTIDVGPYDTVTYGDATCQVTMQVNGGGRATMYLPVYIGFLYPAIVQPLRPATPQETKAPTGGVTGKLRRVWSVGLLLAHTAGLQIGTAASKLVPVPTQFANLTSVPLYSLFDGVVRTTIEDIDTFDGMPLLYSLSIYPAVVCAMTAQTEIKELD